MSAPGEGRTPSPDPVGQVADEAYLAGYSDALADMLREFDSAEKAVGPHAQPDYWYGAKQVVRSLMTPARVPTP